MRKKSIVFPLGLFFIFSTLNCCGTTDGQSKNVHLIVDKVFLSQPLWDDGKAEIAFHNGQIEESSLKGNDLRRWQFLAATVLVKHDYYTTKLMKAKSTREDSDYSQTVPSFKWEVFWGESVLRGGPYPTNAITLHAVQYDLRPLKQTWIQTSFEGNSYIELSFLPDNKIRRMQRGDNYWEPDTSFMSHPNTYPLPQIPLLVRSLDFSGENRHDFRVMSYRGEFTEAYAEKVGMDTIETLEGKMTAEKIIVHYAKPIISEFVVFVLTTEEIYWRSATPNHQILKLESKELEDRGKRISYSISLVEELRSKHWEEDFRPHLKHLSEELMK